MDQPIFQVILSPLRRVVGVGQIVEAAGIAVELIAIEVREAGGVLFWRARPIDELVLLSGAITVSDDRGTVYHAHDAGNEGSRVHWSGQSILQPAPLPGARLSIEVVSFGSPRDHPRERRRVTIVGPWRFYVET